MARPAKDSEWVRTRMDRAKHEALAQTIMSLGYAYPRTDKDSEVVIMQPAWGAFLEAIADDKITIAQKIEINPLTSP